MGIFGLGTPEIILLALIAGIFFFGLPKMKEWFKAFTEAKTEAKKIVSE